MVFSKGVIPFMIMTRFRVGTKKISKIISRIITIFPITISNMHIIIKIIFNSTYRLIFKIIMNAIKLTILHKFLSVRIKSMRGICSGQVVTHSSSFLLLFLLLFFFFFFTLGRSGWRESFSTYPGLSLETIGETWEKLSFLLVET